MKHLFFILLAVLSISTAVAEPNYYGETEKEIYIDKELTLLSMPEFRPSGEVGWFSLAPKKEYVHYHELSKSFKPVWAVWIPEIKGDMAKILEQAVRHAFTPEQLAQIPKEEELEMEFTWDETGNVYMVKVNLENKPFFTSIPPIHYAKLMRYLKQRITFIPEGELKNPYDFAYVPLSFDVEKLSKDWDNHKRNVERRKKIDEEYERKNPGNGK